jgi:hypothetical protein
MSQERITGLVLAGFSGARLVDSAGLTELALSLAAAESRLRELDHSGRWWSPGLYSRVRALQLSDPRYGFTSRLASSMLLGEVLVKTISGRRVPEGDTRASEAAALLHLVVNAFDGICDEVPGLMPDVLPLLESAIAAFPVVGRHTPRGNTNPLCEFTGAVATELLRSLAASAADAQAAAEVAQALRAALDSQLATLRVSPRVSRDERIARRTDVSVGVTRLTVVLSDLFNPASSAERAWLMNLAFYLGHFFAWIDDLADLGSDLRRRHLNAVVAFLEVANTSDLQRLLDSDAPGALTRSLLAETNSRWDSLLCALRRAGLDSHGTVRLLAGYTVAWFGLAPAARVLKLGCNATLPVGLPASPGAEMMADSTRS